MSVFESRAELASADRLVAQWLWEESGGQPLSIRDVTTGEVIAQRGM